MLLRFFLPNNLLYTVLPFDNILNPRQKATVAKKKFHGGQCSWVAKLFPVPKDEISLVESSG